MLGPQIEDASHRGLPRGQRLLGQAIDQIQIQIFETRPPRRRDGVENIAIRMLPFEQPKLLPIGGLDPQAQAIDSRLTE